MSDFYVLDTPLTMQNIPFGVSDIGDKTKKPTRSALRRFTTLNHTLHLVRAWRCDVREGLLLESVASWAKGRRAVIGSTFRDAKGSLVATGEQEGYFVCIEAARSDESEM